MLKHLRPALTLTVAFTLLVGLGYPLAITGLAQTVLPAQANGSLIARDGVVVGSAFIGQDFASDRYFWPRPSATDPAPYNAASSAGSNLATTSVTLRDRVLGDLQRLEAAGISTPMPADALTTSGSGLDPDISPEFARLQVARVAGARQITEARLLQLLEGVVEQRAFGFVGEPRVNVLELNLALDALQPETDGDR